MDTYADALKQIAAPWERGEKFTEVINRAARKVGMKYWRAYDIWYGRASANEVEAEKINQVLNERREAAARNEFHELKVRMARLESMLVQSDPNFHRSPLDRARTGSGAMGRDYGALDRAMAQRSRT